MTTVIIFCSHCYMRTSITSFQGTDPIPCAGCGREIATPESVSRGARVVVLTPPDTCEHYLLEDSLTIGRDPANLLQLRDPQVGRRHARILRSGDRFLLQDLGGRNGTFVNGERIDRERPLADMDQVQIGGVTITFRHTPVGTP
ncbi:MAG: FHA domain-containing protein [Candidatus Riflebacteria bacterium]|nr:FHA domain-containing protein [Candidatus Riflebacteria bacterium]